MARELKFEGKLSHFQGRFGANSVTFDLIDKRLDSGLLGNSKEVGLVFRFKHEKIREIPFEIQDDVEVLIVERGKRRDSDSELSFDGMFDFQGRIFGNVVTLQDCRLSRWTDNFMFFRFVWPHVREIPFNSGDRVKVIIRKRRGNG